MLPVRQLDVTVAWVKATVLQGSKSFAAKLPYLGVAALLVAMAGMMSGLTLGLMSLSKVDVQMLIETGTPREKVYARRIMPLISNPHFLLCTLLLGNALAMEGLPLVLNRVVNPITAIIISVTFVLIAGEIVPQAVCTRYGLAVGGVAAPFVYVVRFLFSPVAWPIGKLLDWLVGHDDSALFRRPQLKALVDLHGTHSGLGGTLMQEEVQVIQGVLDLVHKTAVEVMTPLDKVFMLCTEDVLDEATLRRILASGHSRIPVYQHPNRLHIVGLIITKELARFNAAEAVPVKDVRMRTLPHLPSDVPLFDLLDLFQIGRSHMAVLCDPVVPFCDMYEDEKRSPGHSPAPSSPSKRGGNGSTGNGNGVGAHRSRQQQEGARSSAQDAVRITIRDNGDDNGVVMETYVEGDAGAGSSSGSGRRGTGGQRQQGLGANGKAVAEGDEARGPNGAPGLSPSPSVGGNVRHGADVPPHGSSSQENQGDELWELQGEPVGIITLEDVIEELLHTEIVDETDEYVDNEQTQRVNVGLLIKKLPARLRQHLNAETLLPVLEQTKAVLSSRSPNHPPGIAPAVPHPLSAPNLSGGSFSAPTSANPSAHGGVQPPIIRTTSWTSPYASSSRGSRSPRSTTNPSPHAALAAARASSPQVEICNAKPTAHRLRATMSEGGEAAAEPSEFSDVSSTSSLPLGPYIRRKVSFRLPVTLPPPDGCPPPPEDGLLDPSDPPAPSPFEGAVQRHDDDLDSSSASAAAPGPSPLVAAASIASDVVAAAVAVVRSRSSSVSEEVQEMSEPLLPTGSGP